MHWNADPASDFSLGILTAFTSQLNFLVVYLLPYALSAVLAQAIRHLGNTCMPIAVVTETAQLER
jgi:hypothetical protein